MIFHFRHRPVRHFTSTTKATNPISIPELHRLIVLDQQHEHSCKMTSLTNTFLKLMSGNYFSTRTLPATLRLLSQYPNISIPQTHINYIYSKLSEDIHRLSSEEVIASLLFMGRCDPKYQESMLYEHAVRYYVKSRYELMRVLMRVDFATSLLGVMRNIYGRILTMRYSRRGPPYQKTLDIPFEYRSSLLLLLLKSPNNSSLFLKKLHFEVFKPIKLFYEQQMSENLYHEKNMLLLELILKDLPIWCNSNLLIQEENTLVIQLCCKLMLVAIEEGKEIPKCWKLSVLWKELQGYDDKEEGVRRLLGYLENVMMGEEYISACGSEERINLISQFPALQNTLPSTLISSLHSSQVSFHLPSLVPLLTSNPTLHSLFSAQIPSLCRQLTIPQLITLCQVYSSEPEPLCHLLQLITEVEHGTITSENVRDLLNVVALEASYGCGARKVVRDFLFKYMSDHYRGWKFDVYEQCWAIVIRMKDRDEGFDQSGLYAKSIYEELEQYNRKVGLI